MSEWRSIKVFGRTYQVSDCGEVRITRKLGQVITLKQFLERGWPRVYVKKKRRFIYVHRLVAEAFIGPCPPGQQCRHLNGIKTDNRASNLAWGTGVDQRADDRRNGVKYGPSKKTHCWRGHEFTPDNTRITNKGTQCCLECKRINGITKRLQRGQPLNFCLE